MKSTKTSGAGRYTFTAGEIAEIEAAYRVANSLAQRRLTVLRLYADGNSFEDITQATGYSEASILRFLHKYEEGGLAPLCNEPYSVRRKRTANHYELSLGQIAVLRESYENATKPHIARRLRALLLRSEGKTLSEVASATGLSRTSITQLMKKYREGGVAAIIGKARPHVPLKHIFTPEQKAEIIEARKAVANKRVEKRLDALLLRIEGKAIEQIGSEVGLHPTTVMSLIQKYQENGLESIITNKREERNDCKQQYLSYAEEAAVLEPFRLKVENGGRITTIEVKAALENKIGHSITGAYTRQLMRKHHWAIGWMPPGKEFQDFGDRA